MLAAYPYRLAIREIGKGIWKIVGLDSQRVVEEDWDHRDSMLKRNLDLAPN